MDKHYEERVLYEQLKHSIEDGCSNAMLLAHMRAYDEEVVSRALRYLEPVLGKKRASELKELYRLARAGMILDGVVARYLSFKELKEALIKGFESSFKIRLIPGELTDFEKDLAYKLKHEKYTTREWNFRR